MQMQALRQLQQQERECQQRRFALRPALPGARSYHELSCCLLLN